MQKLLTTLTALIVLNINCAHAQGYSAYHERTTTSTQSKSAKPAASTPSEIALTFYKLSGILPDFPLLAKEYKPYQESYGFEKATLFNNRVEQLKNAYSLLTMQEPIVVEYLVTLSNYSDKNKGFFINNFEERTFFKFNHHNKDFAVVPDGIMDWQWLKVSNAKTVAAMGNSNKELNALIFMSPIYTDSSRPALIQDTNYWLLFAKINKIELYLPDTEKPIWRSDNILNDQGNGGKLNELLNLRN